MWAEVILKPTLRQRFSLNATMKYLLKYLLLYFVSITKICGQTLTDTVPLNIYEKPLIDSITTADTYHLLLMEADTVITFHIPARMNPNFEDTIPGNSNSLVFDATYLFYFKKDKWTALRYVTLHNNSVLRSNPIMINDNAQFMTLRHKASNTEKVILPFIAEVEKNNPKGYNIIERSHFITYRIEIYANNYFDRHFFDDLWLEKEINYLPKKYLENINYSYNRSLNIFYIYQTLSDYVSKHKKQFKFN